MLGKGGFILEIDVVLLEGSGLLLERSGLLLGVLDDMDIPERSQEHDLRLDLSHGS